MKRPHITEDDLAVAVGTFSDTTAAFAGSEDDMEGLDRVLWQLEIDPTVIRVFLSMQVDDPDHEPLSMLTRVYGAFIAGVAAADSAHDRTPARRRRRPGVVVWVIVIVIVLGAAFCVTQSATGATKKRNDLHRDVYAAIRQVFPLHARAAARCITRVETGRGYQSRWRSVYRHAVGTRGEVGPWQFHPGWIRTGWNGQAPRYPYPWRMRNDALTSTEAALDLWRGSGRRFGQHWYLSARACGVR